MELKIALEKLLNRQDLTSDEMESVMRQLMTGEASDAQIGAVLAALRMKSETVDEIAAAVRVMRSLATAVHVNDKTHLVDTCGTGGDGAKTFNISTASAFVVSAAGATVAKHGNRSFSSNSGSADVLEAAGVNLNLTANQVAHCVNELNLGFMFAPAHHSAMKHVINARKTMGVRTIFNILGPLTNPAAAPAQVIGVFNKDLGPVFAEVLKRLGSKHVMVVAAEDGLDEISVASKSFVTELKNGEITQWEIDPSDYDMDHVDLSSLSVDSAQESLNIIQSVFSNTDGAAHDIVCLNAGASIYVSGVAESFAEGVQLARKVIAEGSARKKLNDFIEMSQSF
ncbi:anthranilate phosphoribosyltransferase [Thiomicrorhabdus indica]|uniref:anthranilate phosphoribosyltransferase n=1 Tax=Thiomicrorhabdus indica TaxID=2267253 RepID=UPI00102DE629|nr:anthranilate phosphoribosyltransferase [Thiomicrorhabdus indica]